MNCMLVWIRRTELDKTEILLDTFQKQQFLCDGFEVLQLSGGSSV